MAFANNFTSRRPPDASRAKLGYQATQSKGRLPAQRYEDRRSVAQKRQAAKMGINPPGDDPIAQKIFEILCKNGLRFHAAYNLLKTLPRSPQYETVVAAMQEPIETDSGLKRAGEALADLDEPRAGDMESLIQQLLQVKHDVESNVELICEISIPPQKPLQPSAIKSTGTTLIALAVFTTYLYELYRRRTGRK